MDCLTDSERVLFLSDGLGFPCARFEGTMSVMRQRRMSDVQDTTGNRDNVRCSAWNVLRGRNSNSNILSWLSNRTRVFRTPFRSLYHHLRPTCLCYPYMLSALPHPSNSIRLPSATNILYLSFALIPSSSLNLRVLMPFRFIRESRGYQFLIVYVSNHTL